MNPKDELHARARHLIDAERVEGLSPGESRWLNEHLARCEACAAWASDTDTALRGLKLVSVALPPGLAASTSIAIREQADELKQRRVRNVGLTVVCALSWIVGVASAPLVWRAFAWLGATFELPRPVWELGFALWWLVPATAAGAIVLWYRSRAEHEGSMYFGMGRD
ncbi:MAG: hypothetical protein ACRD2G_16775 [Terriglobia bacterium]